MPDDTNTASDDRVTDEDIQAIMDQGAAGINDLLAAYEPVERAYFLAARVDEAAVTYAIDTNPR